MRLIVSIIAVLFFIFKPKGLGNRNTELTEKNYLFKYKKYKGVQKFVVQ